MVLLIAAVIGLAFAFYLYQSNSKLRDETRTLDQLLRETLMAHERELADHKESVQELAIVQAKLEGFKKTTLTPENSIPKDVHVLKVLELSAQVSDLRNSLNDMTCKFEEVRGKQISERVRLGQIGENFAAFHDQFPYDRKKVKAMFQPIDLIYFGDDEIVMIDVKTGAAGLSSNERKIRDNIKSGRVRFEVHRLDENGYKIERDL